ncbi:MAG: CotH kinase family protein [Alphaproteobacteria bacterium]|nr:CotH kinase family protein [Alphaproteobacteria bacterium]
MSVVAAVWSALLACTAPGPGESGLGESVAPVETAQDSLPPDDPIEEIEGVPPLWSHARGFYDAPFSLTLSAPTPALALRYSLDGSDPAGEGGLDYVAPIEITETEVLRVALLTAEGEPWSRETRTFFFPDAVPAQAAPEGWPLAWWDGQYEGPYAADYEMDPAITGAASWAEGEPMRALPVLSIVMDPVDLFDPDTGIHEHPTERGDAWERVASVELLTPDGAEESAVTCGIRVQGGAGRRPDRTPKKSFRLAFRGEYGAGRWEHRVFPDLEKESFDSVVLRAGYNRTWGNWQDTQRNRSQYVRERFTQELYRDMGHLTPHARMTHLLINGVYWGLYLIEERPDAAFLADHLGGQEEDYDAINSDEVSDGDGEALATLQAALAEDLSQAEAYAAIAGMVDLVAFSDYMLLNFYLGNRDWPIKNWWAGRRREAGASWRFFVWDAELIMSELSDDYLSTTDGTPGQLFQALRANDEYRVLFADRVQRHLEGGLLEPDTLIARWQAESAGVVPAVLAESARWGDHWAVQRGQGDITYTYEVHWLDEQERIVERYLPYRAERFLEQLDAAGLLLPLEAPTPSTWGGTVASGTRLSLSAEAALVYTTDGRDPREPGGARGEGAVDYVDGIEITESQTVKVRAFDGAGWSALVELGFVVE